jgi:hypothetical protein
MTVGKCFICKHNNYAEGTEVRRMYAPFAKDDDLYACEDCCDRYGFDKSADVKTIIDPWSSLS